MHPQSGIKDRKIKIFLFFFSPQDPHAMELKYLQLRGVYLPNQHKLDHPTQTCPDEYLLGHSTFFFFVTVNILQLELVHLNWTFKFWMKVLFNISGIWNSMLPNVKTFYLHYVSLHLKVGKLAFIIIWSLKEHQNMRNKCLSVSDLFT